MKKPNIIFFFTDDQRFDTIGGLNNPNIKTPNLDGLIHRGTAFTNAYIMGGSSGAVCMPSRGMLHTGRSLYRIRGQGEDIDPKHVTLGQVLQESGYTCFGTGKWHNGSASFSRSFNTGAEIFFGGMSDHWNVPACDFDPSGKYPKRPKISNPYADNIVSWHHCDHVTAGKHSTDLFADVTCEFLRHHNSKQNPFFAYVSFMAPHDPRSMPPEFRELYDPDSVELPENFAPQHPFDNGWMTGRDEQLANFPRTKTEVQRHLTEYYAMITHLDTAIGRIIDTLVEQNVLDETIIIFTSDNGLAVGQHGLMGKQNLYDHSIHVPLVMAGPSIPSGQKRDSLVYLIDIFPTLCDLLELPIPHTVEGNSLHPTFNDSEKRIRSCLHFAFQDVQRGIRDERYKLIEYVVNGSHRKTQLFDMISDPTELHNLASDTSRSDVLHNLRNQLKKWQTTYNDTREQGQSFWSSYPY